LKLAESDPEALIKRAIEGDAVGQAVVLALLQEEEAEEAQEELRRVKAWEAEQDDQLKAELQKSERIWELVVVGLESLGFVRYTRNPWKRRSMLTIKDKPTTAEARAKIRALVKQAVTPGPDTIEKLRRLAKAHPVEFVAEVECELFHLAAFTIGSEEFKRTKKRADDLIARMQLLAVELCDGSPSLARRLCAQAVAFCWAEHWILSSVAAVNRVGNDWHPRSIRKRDAAHRRFMKSLKTFAQIVRAEARPKRMQVKSASENNGSIFAGPSIAEVFDGLASGGAYMR
jgi:hypothetical protein